MLWEYKIAAIGDGSGESQLEKLGSDGWELVSVDHRVAYFKRPTAVDSRDAFTHFYNREKSYD